MCPIKIFVCFVLHIITVSSLEHAAESEAAPRFSDDTAASDDLLSRVLGVPGVWWPAAQVTSDLCPLSNLRYLNLPQILGNTWSLLAAGISSAVVGASFLPQIKRMDQVQWSN